VEAAVSVRDALELAQARRTAAVSRFAQPFDAEDTLRRAHEEVRALEAETQALAQAADAFGQAFARELVATCEAQRALDARPPRTLGVLLGLLSLPVFLAAAAPLLEAVRWRADIAWLVSLICAVEGGCWVWRRLLARAR
jgi:hypothetical protein